MTPSDNAADVPVYRLLATDGRLINDPDRLASWTRVIENERRRLHQELLDAFDQTHPFVDLAPIRQFFSSLGLTLPPIIFVPRTSESARTMDRIFSSTLNPLPFERIRLQDIGSTASYCSSYLGLSVVFDIEPEWRRFSEQLQHDCQLMDTIHEGAHGCVMHLDQHDLVLDADDTLISVNTWGNLSGTSSYQQVDGQWRHEYIPGWLDEAWADYLPARYRRDVLGVSSTVRPVSQVDTAINLPDYHLFFEPGLPQPAFSHGAVAAYGLERLDRRSPGLIENLLGVVRRQQPLADLHAQLAKLLPPPLLGHVLGRSPTDEWPALAHRLELLFIRIAH